MQKRLFILLGVLLCFFLIALFFLRHDIFVWYKFFRTPVPSSFQKIEEPPLKVTFLDIGQGDASFIEFPDGTQMLVDCAIDARILEALGRVMSPFDHTIDYLLVTHPDQDHYGGCVDVLKRFDVKHIVYTGYDKESSSYYPVFQDFVKKENAEYIAIQQEDTWTIASTSIHFLFPDSSLSNHEVLKNTKKKSPSNNTSIVFMLSYGNQDILFMADAEIELEDYLVKKYPEVLDAEVLKVGHHGSSGSSSDEFLRHVTPQLAMISSGKNNKYGHPTARVLKRLERAGAEVWRTDQIGDIILYVNKAQDGQNFLYVEHD